MTLQEAEPLSSDEDIIKEWEANMHDFVPEDLSHFEIEGRDSFIVYENISHENPTTVKGAFYVGHGKDSAPIAIVVEDPLKNILYVRK